MEYRCDGIHGRKGSLPQIGDNLVAGQFIVEVKPPA